MDFTRIRKFGLNALPSYWNATLTSLTQSRRDLAGIPGVEAHVEEIDTQIREHLKSRPQLITATVATPSAATTSNDSTQPA